MMGNIADFWISAWTRLPLGIDDVGPELCRLCVPVCEWALAGRPSIARPFDCYYLHMEHAPWAFNYCIYPATHIRLKCWNMPYNFPGWRGERWCPGPVRWLPEHPMNYIVASVSPIRIYYAIRLFTGPRWAIHRCMYDSERNGPQLVNSAAKSCSVRPL